MGPHPLPTKGRIPAGRRIAHPGPLFEKLGQNWALERKRLEPLAQACNVFFGAERLREEIERDGAVLRDRSSHASAADSRSLRPVGRPIARRRERRP